MGMRDPIRASVLATLLVCASAMPARALPAPPGRFGIPTSDTSLGRRRTELGFGVRVDQAFAGRSHYGATMSLARGLGEHLALRADLGAGTVLVVGGGPFGIDMAPMLQMRLGLEGPLASKAVSLFGGGGITLTATGAAWFADVGWSVAGHQPRVAPTLGMALDVAVPITTPSIWVGAGSWTASRDERTHATPSVGAVASIGARIGLGAQPREGTPRSLQFGLDVGVSRSVGRFADVDALQRIVYVGASLSYRANVRR